MANSNIPSKDELIDRVCRGVASIQEGQQLRAYIAQLEYDLEMAHGPSGRPTPETISLPATLKAEGLPDFAEVMRLPPEVLRERYWTQREWIRGYAHCLDGLLGAGADYSGLLPQDIRRAFEARGELKANADPYKAVCQGGTGGKCTDPDCDKCWLDPPAQNGNQQV